MKTDRKIKYDWLQGELCCRLPLARSLPFSPPVPVPVPAPVCPAPSTTRCPAALISLPSSLFLESPDRGCPRAGAGPALGTSSITLPALPTPGGGCGTPVPCCSLSRELPIPAARLWSYPRCFPSAQAASLAPAAWPGPAELYLACCFFFLY